MASGSETAVGIGLAAAGLLFLIFKPRNGDGASGAGFPGDDGGFGGGGGGFFDPGLFFPGFFGDGGTNGDPGTTGGGGDGGFGPEPLSPPLFPSFEDAVNANFGTIFAATAAGGLLAAGGRSLLGRRGPRPATDVDRPRDAQGRRTDGRSQRPRGQAALEDFRARQARPSRVAPPRTTTLTTIVEPGGNQRLARAQPDLPTSPRAQAAPRFERLGNVAPRTTPRPGVRTGGALLALDLASTVGAIRRERERGATGSEAFSTVVTGRSLDEQRQRLAGRGTIGAIAGVTGDIVGTAVEGVGGFIRQPVRGVKETGRNIAAVFRPGRDTPAERADKAGVRLKDPRAERERVRRLLEG